MRPAQFAILMCILVSDVTSCSMDVAVPTETNAWSSAESSRPAAPADSVSASAPDAIISDEEPTGRIPEPCVLAADGWATEVEVVQADCERVLNGSSLRLRVVGTVEARVRWLPRATREERIVISDSICRVRHSGCVMPLETSVDGWRVAGPCVDPAGLDVTAVLHRRTTARRQTVTNERAVELLRALGASNDAVIDTSDGVGRMVYDAIGQDLQLIPAILSLPDPLVGQAVDVSYGEYQSAVRGARGLANFAGSQHQRVCGCRDERLADAEYAFACTVAWQTYLQDVAHQR